MIPAAAPPAADFPRLARRPAELPAIVLLPAGEFVMGDSGSDRFATDTERPTHVVRIRAGLALGRFPVTVGEFRRFRPVHAPGESTELPVARVSWFDACDYCDWLARRTGVRWRLPSEAEWEFACRAGSPAPFACGHELAARDANFAMTESGERIGPGRRTPIGTYPPNAFGLFDLHGNVCEWVADDWHPNYTGAPADGSAWSGGEANGRVIRGGAWDYLPRLLRSAWRDWRAADHWADNIGFRLAATLEPMRGG